MNLQRLRQQYIDLGSRSTFNPINRHPLYSQVSIFKRGFPKFLENPLYLDGTALK